MEQNELETKIDELQKKCDEYLNGWKRERADFINYKKEESDRIGQFAKYANEELVLDFLPVLDNLILAQSHIKNEGLEMVIKQFQELLKKEGIEPIEVSGRPFDPNFMEVVEEVSASADAAAGTVAEEVQRGYMMHEKLVRPAKVKITK